MKSQNLYALLILGLVIFPGCNKSAESPVDKATPSTANSKPASTAPEIKSQPSFQAAPLDQLQAKPIIVEKEINAPAAKTPEMNISNNEKLPVIDEKLENKQMTDIQNPKSEKAASLKKGETDSPPPPEKHPESSPGNTARISPDANAMGRDKLVEQEESRNEAKDQYYYRHHHAGEKYSAIVENEFMHSLQTPLSTLSIDVDTASYANVRRFLKQNQIPPADAVRLEELVNYFDYEYQQPENEVPFAVHAEVAECPWKPEHRLVKIGIKGKEIKFENRPSSNLVFLIDVSGSMGEVNKLPLVKEALKLLVNKLEEQDRIAIVVYAGQSGLALPSTDASKRSQIIEAIDRLNAGGSTHGSAGIQLAYETAIQNYIEGGVNRVILCTDGDFNVGVTRDEDLISLITDKAKSGVYLSVFGFGQGNLQDAKMEQLADKGNGNYAYIDQLQEAVKTLVTQASGTLITIAKDVKIQVDFNPAKVQSYRLLGYENRLLQARDFLDDKKDAGEIGAGHTVTALYEIIPGNSPGEVEPSKYVEQVKFEKKVFSDELLTVRLRYKKPDADVSTGFEVPVKDEGKSFSQASKDFQFAASVVEFGLLIRNSKFKEQSSYDHVIKVASTQFEHDPYGYKKEFLDLAFKAKTLSK